ncbi:MAG: S41 family peptidase [Polyangiaceae bacterium]
MSLRAPCAGVAALSVLMASFGAAASELDASGSLRFDPEARVTLGWDDDASIKGLGCEGCDLRTSSGDSELPLQGGGFLLLDTGEGTLSIPLLGIDIDASTRGRFRASLWVRHSRLDARVVRKTGLVSDELPLYPTGRMTSDGWLELESGDIDIDGSRLDDLSLDLAGRDVQVDGFELRLVGGFHEETPCSGAFDPACGVDELCVAERCRDLNQLVPPLPAASDRASVADYLMARVRWMFGGRLSRERFMPRALAEMEGMKTAESAAAYWQAYERGVRYLHDAHTVLRSTLRGVRSTRRLGACFIEGRADLSQGVWASEPGYADILVSHVAETNNLGLHPGDRLVAVDGQHPVVWARSIFSVNSRARTSTDPDVYGEFVELLQDQISNFARTFSVVRCDPQTLQCADHVETLRVTDIPPTDAEMPSCDNRPLLHQAAPPEGAPLHRFDVPWLSMVADALPEEKVYGVTWNDLLPEEARFFREANQTFRQDARGVILDHRTGNGGVLDAPSAITELVREKQLLSIGTFKNLAGDEYPADAAGGEALFDRLLSLGGAGLAYEVGSSTPDLELPVALLTHRDTSASDWLPHGMKGAPNVKIFGPHETAGAFSSFYQFDYWSGFGSQLASGDTVTFDGQLMIGHGVAPDEVVEHTQSSLLQGVDAPYQRALEWVRSNLK